MSSDGRGEDSTRPWEGRFVPRGRVAIRPLRLLRLDRRRIVHHGREQPLRKAAAELLQESERRAPVVRLLPRPAQRAGTVEARGLLSVALPEMSRTLRLQGGPAGAPQSAGRLHRMPHAERPGPGYRARCVYRSYDSPASAAWRRLSGGGAGARAFLGESPRGGGARAAL